MSKASGDSGVLRLRNQYTRRRWNGEAYEAILKIGCQYFTFATVETKAEVEWYRNQMAHALGVVVEPARTEERKSMKDLRWFEEYAEHADWMKPLRPEEWKELAALLHEVNNAGGCELKGGQAVKYRIVRDRYLGFEAQFRPRWWPLWSQCFGCNTSPSVERARQVADKHARGEHPRLVEHYQPNIKLANNKEKGGDHMKH